MKALVTTAGVIAILVGALWIGQGTGYIMWPRSNFMLQQASWAYCGACLVIVGLVLLIYAARRRRG